MSGSASTRVLHSRDVAGMFAKKWREKSSAYDCRASGYTWCMVLMIGRGNERKSIIATRPEQCSKTYRQCNDEANLRFPSFFFFLNFSKTRIIASFSQSRNNKHQTTSTMSALTPATVVKQGYLWKRGTAKENLLSSDRFVCTHSIYRWAYTNIS